MFQRYEGKSWQMKNKLLSSLFIFLLFTFCDRNTFAQCTGGTSSGMITPGLSWSNAGTTNVGAGNYYNFTATGGSMYYFSFCAADGSNSNSDTQISILDNSGAYAGGYNDDYC